MTTSTRARSAATGFAQRTVTRTRAAPGFERGTLTLSRVGASGALRSVVAAMLVGWMAMPPPIGAIGGPGGTAVAGSVSTTTVRPGLSAVDAASVTSME